MRAQGATLRTTLAALLLGCGPEGSGDSATDGTSAGASSSTAAPTTGDPDGTTTATPTTTATGGIVTGGADDASTGSTTDGTSSTTTNPTTGDSTTGGATTEATTGTDSDGGSESGTGPGTLGPYGDCVGAMLPCPAGSFCLLVPGSGVCTPEGCADASDCPAAPPGGNAQVACLDTNGDMVDDCRIDCSGGQTCPNGMECFSDEICVWS